TSAPACSAGSPCASAIAAVPSCGVSCIASAASAVGCVAGDNACQCSSSQNAAIASMAQSCVISACGINQALAVQSSAAAVCSCVGANPTTPCSGGPTPTGGPIPPVSPASSNSPASSGPVTAGPSCSA